MMELIKEAIVQELCSVERALCKMGEIPVSSRKWGMLHMESMNSSHAVYVLRELLIKAEKQESK